MNIPVMGALSKCVRTESRPAFELAAFHDSDIPSCHFQRMTGSTNLDQKAPKRRHLFLWAMVIVTFVGGVTAMVDFGVSVFHLVTDYQKVSLNAPFQIAKPGQYTLLIDESRQTTNGDFTLVSEGGNSTIASYPTHFNETLTIGDERYLAECHFGVSTPGSYHLAFNGSQQPGRMIFAPKTTARAFVKIFATFGIGLLLFAIGFVFLIVALVKTFTGAGATARAE